MIYNFDELSFQVMMVDRFFHKKGFFDIKARPFAALSFRVSGEGAFEIGNKRLITKAGDILFIPADTPYKVEYSVSESIVVHLDRCNYFEAENICVENHTATELRFFRMLEDWNEHHSVNQVKSAIYDVFDRIARDKKTSAYDTAFSQCIQYMEENFGDPDIDIKAVCGAGFLSASSLQRAFEKHFGVSPNQYLNRLRMNKAMELLSEKELSVKEIAYACGFSDEKYFSRAFKKRYGYPPSKLRNNMIV